MKKSLMFACVVGFGLFICSCNGNFGDIFGTSSDDHHCSRHGHHDQNDHDADDTVIVIDTTASNYIIEHSH